jgi:hypothetical protein
MPILIEFPCKPVVKQYIINRYGSPVKFPRNDYLKAMLVKMLSNPDTNYDSQTTLQYHTASIDLPVEFRLYAKKRSTLTRTDIMLLNQTVQDLIEETLYNYIHLFHHLGGKLLKETILGFREQYGFPEESYSTEAITKFWQRTRERRKKEAKTFTQTVLSPKTMQQKSSIFAETHA